MITNVSSSVAVSSSQRDGEKSYSMLVGQLPVSLAGSRSLCFNAKWKTIDDVIGAYDPVDLAHE
jgi:hypothetical protein